MAGIEHHTVIIVGGGPAGLALAVVLGGSHPHFRESQMFSERYEPLAEHLRNVKGTLLGLDFRELVQAGVAPVDLFRLLHHPRQIFEDEAQIALDFPQVAPLDYLLISREAVGGVWNNVPENMLTLSPGQWMELAFYPLAQHIREQSVGLNVNDLIIKADLLNYYHHIPSRFGQEERIRTDERVIRIEPHDVGFHITTQNVRGEMTHRYTCKYLVYAVGQRCVLRRLDVSGEELPFVASAYDKPESFPGERVLVVGGGRSADWAATELHDAGRQVNYITRVSRDRHWRLINDSRYGLPYYARIAEIIEGRSSRMEIMHEAHISEIKANNSAGLVTVSHNGDERTVEVDHVVKEIGGIADYSTFSGFPPLTLVDQYDNYRFQLKQVPTHPHNYEALDVPNLYMGGYLAAGIGLVVIAMHGTTYAIAGDILQKEGHLVSVGFGA